MKIFGFVNNVFFVGLLMKNQKRKTRPQVVNVNGDEPVFFRFSIETSKCSGSSNNINYPHAKIYVSDLKALNLISRTNETRLIQRHETCKYEC